MAGPSSSSSSRQLARTAIWGELFAHFRKHPINPPQSRLVLPDATLSRSGAEWYTGGEGIAKENWACGRIVYKAGMPRKVPRL
ncbi:uncharacterized protein N7515_006734 [Penicillium bovifimosum]|uniref:Uncharacterized protein n=1 Tax=Penicillium bovifimosum TaxID=126998 RepID=A0A9W9GV98_9EURO|nr:uncharacterized protein N7515_006734 [Penicillium bovifimosum]KAJ5130695.1 hypothetical protein N7515_006734 [Penicillium bovifimosum]